MPFASSGEDCIGDGRGDRGCAGLADPCGWRYALDQVNFYRWHLVNAQHVVVVEIALLDSATIDGDGVFESRSEAVNNAAEHLLFDATGIDNDAAIHSTNDTIHAKLALVERYFSHLSREAADVVGDSDAATAAWAEWGRPGRFCGSEFKHRKEARALGEQTTAKF